MKGSGSRTPRRRKCPWPVTAKLEEEAATPAMKVKKGRLKPKGRSSTSTVYRSNNRTRHSKWWSKLTSRCNRYRKWVRPRRNRLCPTRPCSERWTAPWQVTPKPKRAETLNPKGRISSAYLIWLSLLMLISFRWSSRFVSFRLWTLKRASSGVTSF